MGAPLYDGVYEVILELRDKSDGSTLYSMRITPTLATVGANGWYFKDVPK
jgi:hypothetical protein